MTFRQLEYICAIVREGSISKAAKSLFISQSALSQQLNAMEEEFQTCFFDRTTSPITLTDDGRLYYEAALDILKRKEKLENTVKYRKGNTLLVKSLPFYTSTFVPRVFSIIRPMFPNVDFRVNEAIATELFKSDFYENVDIYINTFETSPITPEGYKKEVFNHEVIAVEKMLLAIAKNNPCIERLGHKMGKNGLPIADISLLKDETFTSSIISEQQKSFTLKMCREYGGFEPKTAELQTTYIQILGLLRFSGYVSILPESVFNFSTIQSDIEFYEVDGSDITRNLYATYHKDRHLSLPGRAFIKAAQKEFLK